VKSAARYIKAKYKLGDIIVTLPSASYSNLFFYYFDDLPESEIRKFIRNALDNRFGVIPKNGMMVPNKSCSLFLDEDLIEKISLYRILSFQKNLSCPPKRLWLVDFRDKFFGRYSFSNIFSEEFLGRIKKIHTLFERKEFTQLSVYLFLLK
jgi:hypothetical protein